MKYKHTNERTHTKNLTTAKHLTHYCSAFLAASLSGSAVFSSLCICFSWRCLPDLLLSMNILRQRRRRRASAAAATAARAEGTRTHFVYYVYFVYIYKHTCIWGLTLCILCVNVERIYLSVCHFNNLHDVLSSLQISYSYTCLNSTHTLTSTRTHR